MHLCSDSLFTGSPDTATVILNDLSHNGQTDTASALGRISGRVGAVEPVKQMGNLGRIHIPAWIGHLEHNLSAFLPQPRFAVYAATKAFVLSYSRALAMELKPRQICVTAVCPGPVKTEFFDIAETTGEIPLYKRLVMADPKKVVKKALRDSMMGKTVSVYGFFMKAFFVLAKILPHDVILSLLFSE